MTRHGRDCPDRCSQCAADAPVRRVDLASGSALVNGTVVRQGEAAALGPDARAAALRGAARRGRRRK